MHTKCNTIVAGGGGICARHKHPIVMLCANKLPLCTALRTAVTDIILPRREGKATAKVHTRVGGFRTTLPVASGTLRFRALNEQQNGQQGPCSEGAEPRHPEDDSTNMMLVNVSLVGRGPQGKVVQNDGKAEREDATDANNC
jgi:hypothetical protein